MHPLTPREGAPIVNTPPTAQDGYHGRAFLYVLLAAGPEDQLKVGMTGDPLARWSAFHPRWFEIFDLEHSLLVETETRGDAQALETQLHRMLEAYSSPMPLTVRGQAGGGTEWYRGAYAVVRRFVEAQEAKGFIVHRIASAWLALRMRPEQDRLDGLLRQARNDYSGGWFLPAQRQALQDLVDAHRFLDPNLPGNLPADVLEALDLRV